MKRSRTAAILGTLALVAPVAASDHLDGTVTTAQRVGDLTDLYAFPTPARPGFLTVLLATCPLAPADAEFRDEIVYTLRVRRAEIRAAAAGAAGIEIGVETGDEAALSCGFATAERTMTCRAPGGIEARSRVDAPPSGELGGPLRIFAGMRSDPFFLNSDFFSHAVEGTLDPPRDDNVLRGANVLALAIEVDLALLFAAPPALVAVAAESSSAAFRGAAPRHLDRVGRPELTNVGLAPRHEPDLRDLFNAGRPFASPAARQRLFRDKLERNLAHYDALDLRTDWEAGRRGRLAALLADDHLLVDLAKPCPPGSFLEIERALLRGEPHRSCGGRRPDDDAIDALFTLYVAGSEGAAVRDGVDRPAAALSPIFPHLAAPDVGAWSRLRAFVGRKFLDVPELR